MNIVDGEPDLLVQLLMYLNEKYDDLKRWWCSL